MIIIFGNILSWIATFGVVYFIAVVLDGIDYSMTWYGSPWLIFGLYVAPIILCACASLHFVNALTKSGEVPAPVQSQLQIHCVRLIWTLLLIIGTALHIRSAYLFMIPVFFNTLSFALIHLLKLFKSGELTLLYQRN